MKEATAPTKQNLAQDSLLYFHNGTVRFGNITALDGVHFSIGKNETVGLLGANGAGKSTLAKALVGYHRVDEGELFFQGVRTEFKSVSDARRQGIEMVFQDLSLAKNLNTACNFFIGNEILSRVGPFAFPNRKRMQKIVDEFLHMLGLGDAIQHREPVGNPSGS